jgi:hypothetical protein
MPQIADMCTINVEHESAAEKHEVKVQSELNNQHQELMRQARGIFTAVKGRRGALTPEYWQRQLENAQVDYESGQFLVERLGADRQLDLQLVATLVRLRQQLVAEIDNPTAADQMMADTAIVAYRNLLRAQVWIGSTAAVVQRELFGQEPLQSTYGRSEADLIERRVEYLEQTLLPLLDRCQRMMIRALDRLDGRRSQNGAPSVAIGAAGQVNIGRQSYST